MKTVRVGKRIIKFDEPPKRSKIVTWVIEHWKILLPVVATVVCAFIAAGVSLFIHFDNKSKSEASQKQGTSPQQVRTEGSQKLIIHNQPTSNRKTKRNIASTIPAKPKDQAPASRIYAKQQVERWRKEIQSFANGGSFNSQEFLKSSTYTEIYPYLSNETMGQLSNRVVTITTSGRPTIEIQNEVLMALYKDLDRIAEK